MKDIQIIYKPDYKFEDLKDEFDCDTKDKECVMFTKLLNLLLNKDVSALLKMGNKYSLYCAYMIITYHGIEDKLLETIENHPNFVKEKYMFIRNVFSKEDIETINIESISNNAIEVYKYSWTLSFFHTTQKIDISLLENKMKDVVEKYHNIYACMFVHGMPSMMDYIVPYVDTSILSEVLGEDARSIRCLKYLFDKVKKLEKDFEDAISPGGIAYKKAEERFYNLN